MKLSFPSAFPARPTIIVFVYCIAAVTFANVRIVRVGIYENPPKIASSKNRNGSEGIFFDILAATAEKEKWNIIPVKGTWREGLDRLLSGEIDIMPDVAFSDERAAHFDFNKVPILNSWLQLYCSRDDKIESLSQLKGKTIAVLDGSLQYEVCTDLQEQMGISFRLLTLPDYQSTFRAVEEGLADAVIAGRFYNYSHTRTDRLTPSPVILNPTTLHFVVARGKNGDLINRIDQHMATMMNNPNSVYYKSLGRWLHRNTDMVFPKIMIVITGILAFIAVLFILFTVILKRQVRKKTNELQTNNEKLTEALGRLETVHTLALKQERLHALGQLASGIAHDFRNLLAPIVSYSDLMLSDKSDPVDGIELRHNLEVIKNAALHGTELVNRMRNFGKTAPETMAIEDIDLNKVIGGAMLLADSKLLSSGTKEVRIVRNTEAGCIVKGNHTALQEMLINLLLNASDAIPEKGIIEITLKKVSSMVILKIEDNGAGMPDDVRRNCLEPFFTTKGENGTGMGLAMVHSIVQEHMGTIELQSTIGKGTTFTITFPAN